MRSILFYAPSGPKMTPRTGPYLSLSRGTSSLHTLIDTYTAIQPLNCPPTHSLKHTHTHIHLLVTLIGTLVHLAIIIHSCNYPFSQSCGRNTNKSLQLWALHGGKSWRMVEKHPIDHPSDFMAYVETTVILGLSLDFTQNGEKKPPQKTQMKNIQ